MSVLINESSAQSSHRILLIPGFGLKELRNWKQEVIWDHLSGRMGCRARTQRGGITDDGTGSFTTGRIKHFSVGEEKKNKFERIQSIRITSHPDFHSPPGFFGGAGFHSKCTEKLPPDFTKIKC